MITKFKLFESTTRMSDQEIHRICKEHFIRRYIINPNGSISVDGDVRLSNRHLKRIPLVFKEVSGDFFCHDNQLTSLKGCPEKVGGDFDCYHNKLTSLEGCPEKMGGYFHCSGNQLTSLEGCPDVGSIYCISNQITSFEGIPEFWEGHLNIFNNPVDEIFELFNKDVRCIDLINEFDVIQGDKVSRDRLEEVFSQLNMEIPKNIKLKEYILT